MQKAERSAFVVGQSVPVRAHGFQQLEGADNVGLDEFARAVDRAVHMRFGGEVEDGARFVLGEQAADEFKVADVALHELVRGIAFQRRKVVGIARVGELIQRHDGFAAFLEPIEYEIGADKTRSAGDNNTHSYIALKR
ncbi:hypothetical protein D3C71_1586560 [compost metagenome]